MSDSNQMEELVACVKAIEGQVTGMSHTVNRHSEEIFGNGKGVGLVQEVNEIHDFMVAAKSSIKTLVTIVSVVGIANLVALLLLIANISNVSG